MGIYPFDNAKDAENEETLEKWDTNGGFRHRCEFAATDLQSTMELRATAFEIAAPEPDLDARAKNDFEAFLKGL